MSVLAVIAAAINSAATTATTGRPQRRGSGAATSKKSTSVGLDLAPRAHWPAPFISGFFSTVRLATRQFPSPDFSNSARTVAVMNFRSFGSAPR